jgi:hypothetical protein
MGAGFMFVAISEEARREAAALSPSEPEPSRMVLIPTDDGDGPPPSRVVDSPALPPIVRKIPVFPARFLEGCSSVDLDTIERGLASAIARGAPLYNEGDSTQCALIYDEAALSLETALPAACGGPAHALSEGRTLASKLTSSHARAWALRDSFDGLIEVLDRNRSGGVQSL